VTRTDEPPSVTDLEIGPDPLLSFLLPFSSSFGLSPPFFFFLGDRTGRGELREVQPAAFFFFFFSSVSSMKDFFLGTSEDVGV